MANTSKIARQQRKNVKARKAKAVTEQKAKVKPRAQRDWTSRFRENHDFRHMPLARALQLMGPTLTPEEQQAKRDREERFLERVFGERDMGTEIHYQPRDRML